jgi:hypothetical protein
MRTGLYRWYITARPEALLRQCADTDRTKVMRLCRGEQQLIKLLEQASIISPTDLRQHPTSLVDHLQGASVRHQ